ncbi:MAG: LA_2272 family surface repeat-containing protein [Opitutales bacterium]
MKKQFISILSVFASALVIAHVSHAEAGFQASLTPEVAIVERGDTVEGLALNIWGENEVRGVDLGFVNGQVGDSSGFTLSLLGGYAENYRGVLWGGFFTVSRGDVIGWQAATVNINQGSLKGLQSGLVNLGVDVTGVQLGFVNYTRDLHGVQVGLANVVESNEWFKDLPNDLAKGFPIVNWSF